MFSWWHTPASQDALNDIVWEIIPLPVGQVIPSISIMK